MDEELSSDAMSVRIIRFEMSLGLFCIKFEIWSWIRVRGFQCKRLKLLKRLTRRRLERVCKVFKQISLDRVHMRPRIHWKIWIFDVLRSPNLWLTSRFKMQKDYGSGKITSHAHSRIQSAKNKILSNHLTPITSILPSPGHWTQDDRYMTWHQIRSRTPPFSCTGNRCWVESCEISILYPDPAYRSSNQIGCLKRSTVFILAYSTVIRIGKHMYLTCVERLNNVSVCE